MVGVDIVGVREWFEIGKEMGVDVGVVKKGVVLIENGLVGVVGEDEGFVDDGWVEVGLVVVWRFGEDVNS